MIAASLVASRIWYEGGPDEWQVVPGMPTAVLAQWGLPLILSAMLSIRSGIKAEAANYDDTILYIRVSGWLKSEGR